MTPTSIDYHGLPPRRSIMDTVHAHPSTRNEKHPCEVGQTECNNHWSVCDQRTPRTGVLSNRLLSVQKKNERSSQPTSHFRSNVKTGAEKTQEATLPPQFLALQSLHYRPHLNDGVGRNHRPVK